MTIGPFSGRKGGGLRRMEKSKQTETQGREDAREIACAKRELPLYRNQIILIKILSYHLYKTGEMIWFKMVYL